MKVSSAADLQAEVLPDGPVRVEACVEGSFDRTKVQSPLAQKNCVVYAASAMMQGQHSPSAYSSKRTDFIVSMVNAPWVKILVESADVLCFGMRGGMLQKTHRCLDQAPDHVKEFVVSHMTASQPQQLPTSLDGPGHLKSGDQAVQTNIHALELEESALVVGSNITLVGQLVRGPGGQLYLQRWKGVLPETSWEACPSKTSSLEMPSQEPWMGKVLACDDPAMLARPVPIV
jgi:hypothetical protein